MELLKDEKKENREEVVKFWATFQKILSPFIQERVKERVLKGWGLEKALRNEGVICVRHSIDLSPAKEMFEAGELKVSAPRKVERVAQNITSKEAEHLGVDMGAPEGDQTVETVYEKTPTGFIPRPKNNK